MADRDAGPGPGEKSAANAADLITGLLFVLVGLAVLYGSWTMPRLANRGIHPLTAPGLVPGLLALALLVCGGLLAAGAWRGGGIAGGLAALAAILRGPVTGRVAAAMALILVYSLGLVGWLPFWLATAVFVTAFIVCFEYLLEAPRPPLGRTLAWALGVGLFAGIAVVLVFERGFLVRLP